MNQFFIKPVLGFAAFSGSGKTSLLVKLIPRLKKKGLRIACIKVTHHNFEIDNPKKDSAKLRKAGASQTLLASKYRLALITEYESETQPTLSLMLNKIDVENIDLILVEGFRDASFPKIEIHRKSQNNKLLYQTDSNIIAVASDENIVICATNEKDISLLNLNDADAICQFIIDWMSGLDETD